MTAIPYKTRTGKQQFRPRCTVSETEDYLGFCLACGESTDSVEPDARRYECPACHAHKVFGLMELALMGLLELEDEPE